MNTGREQYWIERRESGKMAEASRRYRLAHPGEHYKRVKRYLSLNPEVRKAHEAVHYALRIGKLTRLPCHFCSNPKTQAHHADYSKPLDVIWLCAFHHKKEHIN